MGPITVQIQIDGERAQVTMAAEQAPTRQALEQALPSLASALRESGLTLTGGGVFEQPRQARDGQPAAPSGRPGGGDDDGDDDAPAPIGATALAGRGARGVVDLYA
jgi:flagellar hook-length control protein FliK